MDQRASQELDRPLPLLSRLIRLELLMECSTPSELASTTKDDECKDISLALEEVEHRGSIAHRLTMLEKRLFKMRLELEETCNAKLKTSDLGKMENGGRHLESKKDGPFERKYQVEIPREENQQEGGWKRNVKSSGKRRWFICT
ncbi:PREDICTED: uncharacterized protein LOC104806859 isoform X2 [Tarenaya hassleriana]|uniref:uncharacterized protein LOC104806859 isoform X2 n=1 Tax=Tarenaya hassleriana TaxID=28532 RepID=UPI00053CA659|nr:PREDICTED: uncharacterized protein LOC104806859 isoform X2 [Tarenaya hassleriana]